MNSASVGFPLFSESKLVEVTADPLGLVYGLFGRFFFDSRKGLWLSRVFEEPALLQVLPLDSI